MYALLVGEGKEERRKGRWGTKKKGRGRREGVGREGGKDG